MIFDDLRLTMIPKVGESVGNCGGNAHVAEVIDKNKVKVKIPSLGWTFIATVERGFNGVLMAVKF